LPRKKVPICQNRLISIVVALSVLQRQPLPLARSEFSVFPGGLTT
jgi:hypothetical protein